MKDGRNNIDPGLHSSLLNGLSLFIDNTKQIIIILLLCLVDHRLVMITPATDLEQLEKI